MDQVLATFELFDSILLLLPPKDILLSQQTNTKFRDTVKGSSRLQQALFLVPHAFTPKDDAMRPRQIILNPMLFERIKPRLPTYVRIGNAYLHVDDLRVYDSVGPGGLGVNIWISQIKHQVERGEKVLERGSWENMFISGPACKYHVIVEHLDKFVGGEIIGTFETQGAIGEIIQRAGQLEMEFMG